MTNLSFTATVIVQPFDGNVDGFVHLGQYPIFHVDLNGIGQDQRAEVLQERFAEALVAALDVESR